jgi:hypothetical protein
MLTLIIYFLCFYIIFKGVEILQIALMSNRPDRDRRLGLIIGGCAVIAAVCLAGIFGYLATDQAMQTQRGLQGLPGLNR